MASTASHPCRGVLRQVVNFTGMARQLVATFLNPALQASLLSVVVKVTYASPRRIVIPSTQLLSQIDVPDSKHCFCADAVLLNIQRISTSLPLVHALYPNFKIIHKLHRQIAFYLI